MKERNIEVELRSFITKEQHDLLIGFFTKECAESSSDDQVTYYFDAPVDLRIQKNKTHSKIWMKKGKMHSEHREEIEVRFDRDEFDRLEQLFVAMGNPVKVKWFRKRHTFSWKGLLVCLDENRGYGYILEIEKMSDEASKDTALSDIKTAFKELKVEITPKETFDERYAYYVQNWEKLTR